MSQCYLASLNVNVYDIIYNIMNSAPAMVKGKGLADEAMQQHFQACFVLIYLGRK